MKDIARITDSDIEKYKKRKFDVYEKLDMIYFKIHIDADGYSVVNSKGRTINKVDVVVNSVNRDILNFAEIVAPDLYELFGDMKIGFFYLPVQKTRNITYHMHTSEIHDVSNVFILSDWYVEDKSKKDTGSLVLVLANSISGSEFKIITGLGDKIGPYMGTASLGEWFDRNMDPVECATELIKNAGIDKTFTGNDITEIEGLVLRDGAKSYQIQINDTRSCIEPSSKLIYRDVFLESFIRTLDEETMDRVLDNPDKDYVEKICDLFVEYVNVTDFFKTMLFEEDDLVPPVDGYIGDMSYSMLPPIVSVICKKMPVYKNALRTLLVTFSSPDNKRKFERFKPEVGTVMESISKRANGNFGR